MVNLHSSVSDIVIYLHQLESSKVRVKVDILRNIIKSNLNFSRGRSHHHTRQDTITDEGLTAGKHTHYTSWGRRGVTLL